VIERGAPALASHPLEAEERVKILIVDPDPGWSGVLRRLLEQNGREVCGEAESLSDASRVASDRAPDLIAIDSALFLETKERADWSPAAALLVFVESPAAESTVERILSEGPPGVVSKAEAPETWLQAADAVASGSRFLSPSALEGVLEPYLAGRVPRGDAGSTPVLTKRECEVVSLLAEGGRNRELARTLGISVKTVEHHRASAMRKLGVRGVSGLVREAIRLGLVQS
jgi:DNA-binding NarL/FixJ family response regulator